ncbi:MAG: apolipoprotein N-acyltransferase [Spirochaetae bacterium HGW-Spirochaetae-5]|nr:MAG: apolipoprotein N-acyltransferase [Spirochaetae bacterium HGW-Spirochaetae-5]
MNRLSKLLKRKYYTATAILIFLSFPSYDFVLLKFFPVIAWFSLVPLFCYVTGKSAKDTFFASFITGLAGHLFAYGWIGNFGAKVPGGYAVVLLFLIPSLTVFFTLKVSISEYLSQKLPGFRIIIYPSVWIIIDYIQSLGFLAFPWTYIGYSQYTFTPFIQMASVTGILGVNFIIIMFNSAFAQFLISFNGFTRLRDIMNNKYFIRFTAVSLLIVVITISGFIRLSIKNKDVNGKTLKVAVIQSCISPWENWSGNRFNYLAELIQLTRESLKSNPDFIVWSESATLELISFRAITGGRDSFDERLINFIKENGKPLLTGEIGLTVKKNGDLLNYYPQNNAVLISGSGEVMQTYSKINLVPFGEWFPYEKWLVPVKNLVESFGGSSFVPGKNPELFSVNGLKYGNLICYEGIFTGRCRDYRRMGADFFVNITNDGWTDTYNGHYQHYSASIFRAVENGIWMVRAGNTGVSSIIDPKGKVVSTIPILKKSFLTGEIDTSQNVKTFYSIYGDLILYASMIFILIILLWDIFKFLRIKYAG